MRLSLRGWVRARSQRQLGQVTLGVHVPGDGAVPVVGVAGMGAGLVAQVPPLRGGQDRRGDEVAALLVVDGAAVVVEVAGEVADRREHAAVPCRVSPAGSARIAAGGR
jgi:hypothetical protein